MRKWCRRLVTIALALSLAGLVASCGSERGGASSSGMPAFSSGVSEDAGSGSEGTALGKRYPLPPNVPVPPEPPIGDFVRDVGVVRMLPNGTLEYSVETWLNSQVQSYEAALENCQSLEEAYVVVQEYGLAPEDMSYTFYKSYLEIEVANSLPSGTSFGELGIPYDGGSSDIETCSGYGCLVLGRIDPPFFYAKSVPHYFTWLSFNGGKVTTLCEGSEFCACEGTNLNVGGLMAGSMLFWPPLPDVYWISGATTWYAGLVSVAWVACGD